MVSTLSLVFMVISLLIMFLYPVALVILFYKTKKISLKAVAIGALIFFIFQIITRIPLLGIIQNTGWYITLAHTNLLLVSLFLGLTAGLFEEVGRFIGFKFLLRKNLEWKNGIAFGIGHGGIEAMFLGLGVISNLFMSLIINSGSFDVLIGNKLPADQVQNLKSTLIDTPSAMFLLGGIERILAITIQIAFSLLVMYAVMKRKYLYLLLAIILHAVVDSPLIFLSKYLGTVWTEVYVLLCAVIALVFIVKSRHLFFKETDHTLEVQQE